MGNIRGDGIVEYAAVIAERPYRRFVIFQERPYRPHLTVTRGVLGMSGQARQIVARAEHEADRLGHDYAGTEHLLLGLIRGEGDNAGSRSLELMGISLQELRQQVEEIIGEGEHRLVRFGHIRLTPRACKVMQLSRREALRLGHDYIGSEHILLGLIAEGEGVGAQVLIRFGADLRAVRAMLGTNLNPLRGRGTSPLLDIYGRLASIDAALSALHLPHDDEPEARDSYRETPRDASGAAEQSDP